MVTLTKINISEKTGGAEAVCRGDPLFFRLFPAPKPVLSLSKGLGAGTKGRGLIFSLYIGKTSKRLAILILSKYAKSSPADLI